MDQNELAPIFRMPALLGPAPGPRNMPHSKAHLKYAGDVTMFSVSALSDETALTRLLPKGCRLSDGPLIHLSIFEQHNLGWLAGRGYNYLTVRIPVIYQGPQGEVKGNFMPVLWENMADPIITGRDELGSPKLFANIPNPGRIGDTVEGSADWDGFRFFEMTLHALQETTEPPPAGLPLILYRYLARTGDWQKADVAQITKSSKGQAPTPTLLQHFTCQGEFKFNHARWEDMPTQFTYINTLADLPLHGFHGGRIVKTSGIADLAAYEILHEVAL